MKSSVLSAVPAGRGGHVPAWGTDLLGDCDVIQADGGTRHGLHHRGLRGFGDAVEHLRKEISIPRDPIQDSVAAISVGLINGEICLT